jgi:hypothetical protein
VISGLPLGSPETKSHVDVGLVERCRVSYKGEDGGFLQVQAMVSFVCSCCPWLFLAPKVFQLRTNHLVWVLCRPVWVSEACQLFLVPSQSSNTPLYPSKCCELRSVPRLLLLPLFFTWTHIWVFQGVGSASQSVLSTYVVVTGSKGKGFRWGINTWSLIQITTSHNQKSIISSVQALNANIGKALFHNLISKSDLHLNY